MSLTDLQNDFIALTREKKRRESELSEINDKLTALSDLLCEQMAAQGVQNVKMTDGSTLYIRTDRYVNKRSGVSQQQVCDVLERLDLGYMVSLGYNAASLKSKVKEMQEQEEAIPEELSTLLNIGEMRRVVAVGL